MRLRFGAAPTGYVDLAEARWAILSWDFARRDASAFVLAIEQTDPARDRSVFAAAVEHDLHWLGLSWARVERQSERLARYTEAADMLRRSGRLYPCFESEAELAAKRGRRRKRGQPTTYDRAMLHLTAAQRAAAEAGGKRPYWRFRLSDGAVRWRDTVVGPQSVPLAPLSDPVLVRADGTAQRLLATVVDELDLGASHALRDAARIAGTALELDLRAALAHGAPPPVLAHHPALSYEAPLPSLRRLRADGVEPAALLAHLGAGHAHFSVARLRADNRRALAAIPFEAVATRLPAGATAAFWHAVRGGIDLLGDAAEWWEVVGPGFVPTDTPNDSASASPSDLGALRAALDAVPPPPWSQATWRAWLHGLGDAPECAALLRRALVGEDEGPAMDGLLPLIGPERARARLCAALARLAPRP